VRGESLLPKAKLLYHRKNIPKIFTDDTWAQLLMYRDWKMFGWPFDKGWANHPEVYLDIIKTLEAESNRVGNS